LTTQDAGAAALAVERAFVAALSQDAKPIGSRATNLEGAAFDAPNLDAMQPDELQRLASVFQQLGKYAAHKANAMRLRADGLLNFAADNENECERVYRLLPTWAQW
jgi:hypothetical protein